MIHKIHISNTRKSMTLLNNRWFNSILFPLYACMPIELIGDIPTEKCWETSNKIQHQWVALIVSTNPANCMRHSSFRHTSKSIHICTTAQKMCTQIFWRATAALSSSSAFMMTYGLQSSSSDAQSHPTRKSMSVWFEEKVLSMLFALQRISERDNQSNSISCSLGQMLSSFNDRLCTVADIISRMLSISSL